MSEYQIVWHGVFHDNTGYARAARESVLALDAMGLDVRAIPLNLGTKPAGLPLDQIKALKALMDKPASRKPSVLVCHHPPYLFNPDLAKNEFDAVILNALWETTKLPDNWFPSIKKFHRLMAASQWIKDMFQANEIETPCDLVPFGTDTRIFNEVDEKMDLPFGESFKFLSVGTWQHRKGFDLLLRAFWEEFGTDEGVCLILKTYAGNTDGWADRNIRVSMRQFRKQFGIGRAPVYLVTSDLIDGDMVSLYNAADVFVLPSRGEGVGLPYLEAMSRGLPVIGTTYGGQESFLTHENSYIVSQDVVPVPTIIAPPNSLAPHLANMYNAGMMWGEADIFSLRQCMRQAFANAEDRKLKAATAKSDSQGMTWAASAKAIQSSIEMTLEKT